MDSPSPRAFKGPIKSPSERRLAVLSAHSPLRRRASKENTPNRTRIRRNMTEVFEASASCNSPSAYSPERMVAMTRLLGQATGDANASNENQLHVAAQLGLSLYQKNSKLVNEVRTLRESLDTRTEHLAAHTNEVRELRARVAAVEGDKRRMGELLAELEQERGELERVAQQTERKASAAVRKAIETQRRLDEVQRQHDACGAHEERVRELELVQTRMRRKVAEQLRELAAAKEAALLAANERDTLRATVQRTRRASDKRHRESLHEQQAASVRREQQLREQLCAKEEEHAVLSKRLAAAETRAETLAERNELLRAELSEVEATHRESLEQVLRSPAHAENMGHIEMHEQLLAKDRELSHLQTSVAQFETSLRVQERELEQQQAEFESLARDLDHKESDIARLTTTVRELRDEVRQRAQTEAELRGQLALQLQQQGAAAKGNEVTLLSRRITQLEEQLATRDAQVAELVARLARSEQHATALPHVRSAASRMASHVLALARAPVALRAGSAATGGDKPRLMRHYAWAFAGLLVGTVWLFKWRFWRSS